MSQFISLEQAIAMTTLYRNEKEKILADEFKGQHILARAETFDRTIFDSLLAKTDCEKIRIYYGMDDQLKVHAIVVPVNGKNEDILPEGSARGGGPGEDIGDDAQRCPDDCPPPSPLNP